MPPIAKLRSLMPGTLRETFVHEGSKVRSEAPLEVVTPSRQWSYSFSCSVDRGMTNGHGGTLRASRFVVDVEVLHGQVGLGWTLAGTGAFLMEKFVSEGRASVVLPVAQDTALERLVLRNASSDGAAVARIHSVRAEEVRPEDVTYPVSITARRLEEESVPQGGDTATFDTEAALAINHARLAWLEAADLPLNAGRVLDIGAGVGHFISHYKKHGCTVVAADGRADNIQELIRRHPDVEAHVVDAHDIDATVAGTFDVVHCFGLLYHLEDPVRALRRFAAICNRFMVLETMVCDAAAPVTLLADETKTVSQALRGLGCRPSPSFLALALNRVGFRHVYGASRAPRHQDFLFEWRDNLGTTRDGHPLRVVLVASHEPIDSPLLTPLID
jgi:SAM-dependent methyltransferase